jgi:hypothetical protein
MNDAQKKWILEAERVGALSEKQTQWLAEARKMGAMPPLEPIKESMQPFSGDILPVSRKEPGGPWEFDSDAGLVGTVKRAIQLPRQVYEGKVDPLSDEGSMRALEAATIMSPMGAASRAMNPALNSRFATRKLPPNAPTRKALKEATTAGYKQARALGAEFNPQSVKSWADDTVGKLNAEGQIAKNYPEVHNLLDELRTVPNEPGATSSITLESVDAFYRELGRLAGSPDAPKASAAAVVQGSFDDFIRSLDPADVVAGTTTPQRAAQILKDARGNAAAGFRSDRVTGLEKTSARRTAAANSGRNADNNIRQRLTSLIESHKGSRGLSKAEEQAIDDIIFGRPSKNAARYIGNLLGGGGGLGSALLSGATGVGGATAFGPTGAALGMIPPVIGAAARGTANAMTKKELKALDALIRSRSPIGEAMAGPSSTYQPGVTQGLLESLMRAAPPTKPKSPGLIDYGWI